MRTDTEEIIDRLIHDAEHAEAGAEFAQLMMQMEPTNAQHCEAYKRLAEEARQLRAKAERLRTPTPEPR